MGLNPQLRREIAQGRLETVNLLSLVSGSDPAAGAEVSQTVPAGKYWELLAVSVQLVQGITDTPLPVLVIDNGTTPLFEVLGASAAQAVSTTCRYNWAPGLPLSGQIGSGVNVHATAPLGEFLLPPGYRIRTATIGLTATGNYGVPTFYVAQYG